jgi:hypothetical protein
MFLPHNLGLSIGILLIPENPNKSDLIRVPMIFPDLGRLHRMAG